MKNRLLILAVMGLVAFSSCNDFNRLVTSTDNEMKYEVAVDYYERGDYNHALQLFDLLQASFRNTPRGESITYKTALCYYYQDDYDIAGYYFNRFVQTYPFSKDAEKAAFMSAYCSYRVSPESGLDQTSTHTAIKQLNSFIEQYPKSDSLQRAQKLLTDLNNKLEEKDYNTCRLFSRLLRHGQDLLRLCRKQHHGKAARALRIVCRTMQCLDLPLSEQQVSARSERHCQQSKKEIRKLQITMDFKKIKTETTVVTRQKDQFYKGTGNIYETVAILSIRANQIASEMKAELNEKIESFAAATNDSLEEVFENKEQIEIAKFYERLPKPTLIAIHEFLHDQIYFRNPAKENQEAF